MEVILVALEVGLDLLQKNIYGDITSKDSKILIGNCSICNRKKSMTVSHKTILAEGLSDFFKNLAKKGSNISKRMARNVLRDPGGAFDNTALVLVQLLLGCF